MKEHNRTLPFSSAVLRCLALCLMLLDHMWISVIPGNNWLNALGRLAFPIFAFQAAEGYFHTSDYKKYTRRLLVFGLISELPFNLLTGGYWLNPFHQNVMFTLLFGLAALHAVVRAMGERGTKQWILTALTVLGCCLGAKLLCLDYGEYGVFMVLLFGLTRQVRWEKFWQLAGMILVNIFLMEGMTFPVLGFEFPMQGFAVLSLVLIWLYNGRKGFGGKTLQYISYLFYPVHMAILAGIRYFCL